MTPRLTIVLCIGFVLAALAGPAALLVGAERGGAAFGDSETFGVNRLSSATLDIGVGETTTAIEALNMAPGDTVTRSIEVRNQGDLALRYALVGEVAGSSLDPWLQWQIWPLPGGSTCAGPPDPAALLFRGPVAGPDSTVALFGDPLPGRDPGERTLEPGDDERLCISATLSIEAPDRVQRRSLVQSLVVMAEQDTGGRS